MSLLAERKRKKYSEKDGIPRALVFMRRARQTPTSGVLDSQHLSSSPLNHELTSLYSCHIDTAWLWPYSVTQQKVARSWSTQVDLMERYPEHRFTCSSAQQYKWLEQLYPPLFDRVKEKVLQGKFHTIGGSWVENDSNMPSGEALIRQFLFGQRYFESRFGKRCDTAWLPDSFGLTGSLPQLIRGSGALSPGILRYLFQPMTVD
jgi:alpha-mannosidase